MNWLTQSIDTYSYVSSQSTLTGEIIKTLSTAVNITGRIRPLSMGERYMRNKEYSDITHCMYSTYDINPDVVSFNSVYYDVPGKINPMSFGRHYRYDLKATV